MQVKLRRTLPVSSFSEFGLRRYLTRRFDDRDWLFCAGGSAYVLATSDADVYDAAAAWLDGFSRPGC